MKASLKKSKIFGVFWLLALIASSCVLPGPRLTSTGQAQDPPYRPPTLAPTALPTSEPTEASSQSGAQATQPANCSNVLSFVKDVTIPDGALVAPGSRIDKRWEVENSGTCNWSGRYRLKLVSGDGMGLKPDQAVLSARGGSHTVIRLLFTAPKQTGTYRSAWQAYNPDGQPFGDMIYVEVVVSETAPTTLPTP